MKKLKEYSVKLQNFLKGDMRERNRKLILLFGLIFLADYLMFCLHTEKNIFNIFPAIPEISSNKEINIYVPAIDASDLWKEKRSVPQFQTDTRFITYLFNAVQRGSNKENTSILIPTKLFIRNIWLHNDLERGLSCFLDIEPVILPENAKVVPGSEKIFIDALKKTITENIPKVKDVKLFVHGNPKAALWELN